MKKLLFQKSNTKITALIIALFIIGSFLFFSGAKDASASAITIPKGALSDYLVAPLEAVSGSAIKEGLLYIFKLLLIAILTFFSWLLSVSAMLFAWAADATSLTNVINGTNIYKSWTTVRDLLNIAFIIVLLYTAFTIIFQVDKTNKKIILTVVLMALLVNFSFPITRFIIDVGNSLMYTIFKNLFPDATSDLSNIFSNIAEKSAIGDIITNTTAGGSTLAQIIGAIVFVAIMATTLLMMSILFVIRIIVLAILIIFSPIAFVGVILPSSVTSKIDWWGNLFKYTFFGPAMAFMLYIATNVMSTAITGLQDNSTFKTFGQDINGGNIITGMSNFAIPIVILWIGMGVAQQMGVVGAAMAQKWSSKAVMWLPKALVHSTGVPGGLKQAKDYYIKKGAPGFLGKIPGLRGEEKTQSTEAWIASKLGVKGAKEQDMKKRAEEYKKENTNVDLLKSRCSAGDAAACYRLADDKDMDQKTYDAFASKNKDKGLQKSIDTKVKQNRADLFITNKVNNLTTVEIAEEKAKGVSSGALIATATDQEVRNYVSERELGNLSAEKLADQDWTTITDDINKSANPIEQKRLADSMVHSIGKLKGPAQAELIKRIGTTKVDAINKFVRSQGYPTDII